MVDRVRDILHGLREGYPLCCVLRFSASRVRGQQAVRRGVMHAHTEKSHVPCGVFHHGTPWHLLGKCPTCRRLWEECEGCAA